MYVVAYLHFDLVVLLSLWENVFHNKVPFPTLCRRSKQHTNDIL